MVEMLVGIVIMGIVLASVMSIMISMQKGSARSSGYADAQQNTRVAVDYLLDHLRQAGANTDVLRGQRWLVHGGPYQVVINADVDNGQTISGNAPLEAISIDHSPSTVPPSGGVVYAPARTFTTGAETIVLTLDSDGDGAVSGGDRGDDPEESGHNQHLYVLKRVTYGFDGGGANQVRTANLAMVRGPVQYSDGTHPPPLFQYYFDHDDDIATPDKLWGDNNPEDGVLNSGEIAALVPVPDPLLSRVRKVRLTVIGESIKFDNRFADNDGFLAVEMSSEVYLRNASRANALLYGTVFHDADDDGVMDQGESGIPDVEVRLLGGSKSAMTDNFGKYYMPLTPGDYSIQEIDPYGYSSTTPNLVSVTLVSGQAEQVNFGDLATTGFGVINGKVYEDLDQDGVIDTDETGIAEVLLSLDSGDQVTTDSEGIYTFVVEMGNYVLVETDKDGYGSTTPNSVEIVIASDGDTVTVDFGDVANPNLGTIEGYVFLDDNKNGVRDMLEEGLPNASIHLSSGDSTVSNTDGYYQFNVEAGTYEVSEVDPEGYTSTTPNTYSDIVIVPDTTVTRHFGDILDEEIDFVEIVIGDTERALSVRSMDFEEDNRNDRDVVLGTPFTNTTGNLLVYQNQWTSANTPLTKLFDASPTYRRNSFSDINAITAADLSGDDNSDVVTGQEYNTGSNILAWFNNGGDLSNSPDYGYATDFSTFVMDAEVIDYDRDGILDLVVGLRTSLSNFTGGVQTFRGGGGGVFTADQTIVTAATDIKLGEVWGMDVGDLDGDGDFDIVVGTRSNTYLGYIDIYLNGANGKGWGAPGVFIWDARYTPFGAVNDIKVIDMKEDDQGDPDILAATSTTSGSGAVLLWLNRNGMFGKPDTTGHAFEQHVTPHWPNDGFNPQAECLSIDAAPINRDVFPEVIVGTRSSQFYTGDIYLLKTFGLLPTHGHQLNNVSAGEVNTIDLADFNKDLRVDIVVGTRTSITQGKLVVYFYSD